MVRREVKEFIMETSLGKAEVNVPFSLSSAISEGKVQKDEIPDTVTFSADIHADSIALSIKHIYVKLGRFSAPCEVLLNDTRVGYVDGDRVSYFFDLSGALTEGANKLSFKFSDVSDHTKVGIFSPVEIVRFNNAVIDKVSLTQKHDGGTVTVGISLDMVGNTENVRAVATLTSSAGQIYYAGLTRGKGSITVIDPLFWWPHGYGVQNLYKLTVNLYGDVDIEDSVEMRIGLRTVETAKSVDGSALTVTGVEILPMGAVYRIDEDLSAPNLERKVDAFITFAAMANYNTIVIPSDSPRPIEKFYDACDIHGIMVIEEVDGISEGYLDTLERVSHHPSLCLLDIKDRSNIEEVTEAINLKAPELGFSIMADFPKYPSHPSLPHTKTLFSELGSTKVNPTSPEMEAISDAETTCKIMSGIIERYPYPANLKKLSYISEVASANKISEVIKTMRLGNGSSGRAVFDCLGDSEVTASSSAIDAKVRRKALQFYAHKFFAPIALYADNDGGSVCFSVSSQRKLDFSGTIEYKIADAKNVTVYKNAEPVEFDGMATKKLFTRDLSEYIMGHEHEYYLEYCLREGESVIYSDVLLFVPEKHFAFEDPGIECEIAGADKKFSITLTAKSFAKDVEFDFEGADAVFSENYLNITTASPVKITLNVSTGMESALHLKKALKVRSIYEIKKI